MKQISVHSLTVRLAVLVLGAVLIYPTRATSAECVPPSSGLVGWWSAEGNASDNTGQHNGILYGATFAPGKVGQAFSFDGISKKVSVPDSDAFKLTDSLTIEGWIYINTFPGAQIFFRGDNRPGLDAYTLSVEPGEKIQFSIGAADGQYEFVQAPIAAGQWKHVAAELDGSEGTLKIYIDGVPVAQKGTALRPMADLDPASEPAVGIGNHGGTYHNFPFNGLIDEIALYARALSASEIQAIFDADSAGKCRSPGSHEIDPSSFAPRVNFSSERDPSLVAAADLDGDGKPEMITVNYQSNILSIFRNTSSPGSITEASFAPRVDFPAGPSPASVVVGDLDGDGRLDVVVANDYGANISVYRNTSEPGQLSLAPLVNFAAGTHPVSLGIADFDGDGKPDIVVVNAVLGPSSVGVFRNTTALGSTDLSFADMIEFPTGDYSFNLAVGDVDGDGKPDLAVANEDSATVSLLRNTGGPGSISFAERVDLEVVGRAFFVALGDLNGDGKPEVAVAHDGGASVFENASSSGNLAASSFGPRIDLPTPGTAYDVAFGDIDGDGKLDLAVTTIDAPSVSVFQNLSRGGTLNAQSFGPKIDFAGAGNSIVIADMDLDGKPDLVTALNPFLSVYRNTISENPPPPPGPTDDLSRDFSATQNPNGVWSYGYESTLGGPFTLFGYQVTSFADNPVPVNSWAKNGHEPAAVYHNGTTDTSISDGGAGVFPPGTTWFYPGIEGHADNYGVIRFTVPSGGAGTYQLETAVRAYLDGPRSGDTDFHVLRNGAELFGQFVAGNSGTGYSNRLSLVQGDTIDFAVGRGQDDVAFDSGLKIQASVILVEGNPPRPEDIPVITSVSPTVGPLHQAVTILGSNFNSGASGNIVYFGAVRAEVADASTTELNVIVPLGATYAPITVTVGGLTAFAYSPFVMSFAGGGLLDSSSLAPRLDLGAGDGPIQAAIGDLDGDGRPDLVVVNDYDNTMNIWRNTATAGSLSAASFAPKLTLPTGPAPYVVVLADVDGDGRLDIVVPNRGDNTVSVWRNLSLPGSLGHDSIAPRVDFATGALPLSAAVADLDGDGRPDIATANFDGDSVSILRNTGAIGHVIFAPKVDFPAGGGPHSIAIGDLNGDGKPELVTANYRDFTVSVFRNLATAGSINSESFAAQVNLAGGGNTVAIGDLDGDGKADLAVGNWPAQVVSLHRNIISEIGIAVDSFAPYVNLPLGGNAHTVAISDLDGDGKPDLVVVTELNSTLGLFRNNSTPGSLSPSSFGPRVDFSTGWNAVGIAVGDLDGDGKPDLVFCNAYDDNITLYRNTVSENPPPPNQPTYDLSRDFSQTDNPNGAWSYGYLTELNGSFGLVSVPRTFASDNGVPIAAWELDTYQLPGVWKVLGPELAVSDGGRFTAPPGTVYFAPGFDGAPQNYGAIRFTVPAGGAGEYRIETAVRSLFDDTRSRDADFHVVKNGQELFGEFLPPNSATGYSNTVQLAAGDTIDFAIGRGADGLTYDTGLKIQASVTALSTNVLVARKLTMDYLLPVHEGDLVSVPLRLVSEGGVGAMIFALNYNPDYLSMPEVVWDTGLDGALKQMNLPSLGEVVAVFALPGTAVPGGTQLVATVNFRARTVPSVGTNLFKLEVIDVAAPDGEPMPYGNAGDVGSVEIHGGGSPGDNNGNDHLDVGDATLVLRLLARLDSTRPWDVPRNDLNQNGVLDSGDVIKILRAAAAIDPQPQLAPAAVDLGPPGAATPVAGALPSMTESLFLPELAVLNPLKFGGTNGQLVTVQVRLTNIRTPLSGASFTLNYPVTALRLPGAQFHHAGPLVPVNAMAVWNVAPAQNNYALQNGHVTLAVSSAIAWPNNNGVLAEFTFEVQPGATNQFAWPLTLTGVEITSDGFDTRPLFPSAGVFIGRKPLSGLLSVLRRHLSGELQFTLTGDPGATYSVEASSDLAHWATLTNVVSSTGSLPFVDPQASNFSKRFYRARPAE